MSQVGITVEKCSRESREYQDRKIWGVQFRGNWFNLYTPSKPVIGSFYQCEVKETESNGKVFRDAYPIEKAAELPQVAQNGTQAREATPTQPPQKPTLTAILAVIPRVLSALPEEWKQDVQHGRAYAQVLNTILIGINDGKIVIDEDLDAVEQPASDGVTVAHDVKFEPWARG